MWTVFVHTCLFVVSPVGVPQYKIIMISEPAIEAKKIFVDRLKDNINNYIYIYEDELINAWDDVADLPGFADPNMSLSEAILREDSYVINTATETFAIDRDVTCVSCGFVNTYGTPDIDEKTYQCFKCKSGW